MKLNEYLNRECGISSYLCIATDNTDKTNETFQAVVKYLFDHNKVLQKLLDESEQKEEAKSQEETIELLEIEKTVVEEDRNLVAFKVSIATIDDIATQFFKCEANFENFKSLSDKVLSTIVSLDSENKKDCLWANSSYIDDLKKAILECAENSTGVAIKAIRKRCLALIGNMKDNAQKATQDNKAKEIAPVEENASKEELAIKDSIEKMVDQVCVYPIGEYVLSVDKIIGKKLGSHAKVMQKEDFLEYIPETDKIVVLTHLKKFIDTPEYGKNAAFNGAFINAMARFRKGSYVILMDNYVTIQNFLEKFPQVQSLFGDNIIEAQDYTDEEFCAYYFELAEIYGLSFLLDESLRPSYVNELVENRDVLQRTCGYQGKILVEYLIDCAKKKNKFVIPQKVAPMEKLNAKIGLGAVKTKLKELTEVLEYDKKLKALGKKSSLDHGNMHMVFMGNPGTGKTMVAKMIGEILANAGIIKENKVISMTKTDISTALVNESQIRMRQKIHEAMGGVLFIDEAYTLTPEKTLSGFDPMKDVIQELIDAMNTFREEFIVIFAGYTNDMKKFLESNAGLSSRIGFTFNFEDYTADELTEMFMARVRENGLLVPQILDCAYGDLLSEGQNIVEEQEDDYKDRSGRNLTKKERKAKTKKKLGREEEDYQALDDEIAEDYGFEKSIVQWDEPKPAKLQLEDGIRNIMSFFRGMKHFGNGRFVETVFMLMLEKHKYNALKGNVKDIGAYEEEEYMNLLNNELTCPSNPDSNKVEMPYVVNRNGYFTSFLFRNEASKTSSEYPTILCLHPKDLPTIPEIVSHLANKDDFSLNPNKDIWETDELDFLNKIEKKSRFSKMKEKLVNFYLQEKYNQKTDEANLKIGKHNRHMLFTGNPGTGKTTIANIIAEALAQIGVIGMPKCVTADRSTLVGFERDKDGKEISCMSKVLADAMGGILFIDEAYDLVHGSGDSLGLTAVAELIKAMEDNRDELLVILAGYKNSMSEFLKSNEGLKSRIGYTFHFDDFEPEALMDIFKEMLKENGYKMKDDVLKSNVKPIMDYFYLWPNFGNGRFVEKIYNLCITKHAKRVVKSRCYDFDLTSAQMKYLLKDEGKVLASKNKAERQDLVALTGKTVKDQLDLHKVMQVLTKEDVPSISEVIDIMADNDGMVRPEDVLEDDFKRTAIHELGHAIVNVALGNSVKRITCSPSANGSLGYMEKSEEDYRYIHAPSKQFFLDQICIALGGIAAEKCILGEYDAGGGSDLQVSRNMAGTIIRSGFSKLGLLYAGIPTIDAHNMCLMNMDDCKHEMNEILMQEFARATALIESKRGQLEKFVPILLKEKFIEGNEIKELFKKK